MTEQNQQKLVIYTNRATALLTAEAETDVKEAARKLMKLTPGGNRLNAEQAADLAVYALLTGLNPFNNECYYMDKVGVVPGIAGYRVKAMDWLMASLAATKTQVSTTPRIWEEYRPATTEEADFDPDKGDIAWVCTLYDSVSRDAWEVNRIMLGLRYREMGATFSEAYEHSKQDVGRCPHWESVGVVRGDEHFSGNVWRDNKKIEGEYKPEMWDRNERAKKRAAKGCYRKGFPKLNIPDAEEGQYITDDAKDFVFKVSDALKADVIADSNKPKRLEADILKDLGFEPDPPKKETAPVPVTVGKIDLKPEPTELEKAEAIAPSAPSDDDNPFDHPETWNDPFPPAVAKETTPDDGTIPNGVAAAMKIKIGKQTIGDMSLDEMAAIIEDDKKPQSLRNFVKLVLDWKTA